MKYMGSKRSMLTNGLGDVLDRELRSASRFVDLFAGSGAVSLHVARNSRVPIRAVDAQDYSAVLINAVVRRKRAFEHNASFSSWVQRAKSKLKEVHVPNPKKITTAKVNEMRVWSGNRTDPITRAYGGYYFSPKQAMWLDALRSTLPRKGPANSIALASLVKAASQCAASPGHTAQPFRPTRTAKKYLVEAWSRDVVTYAEKAFRSIAEDSAQRKGTAQVGDANKTAAQLKRGDLAFIDPPYSGVQYSRFYHVLETVARGHCGTVSGAGRYPPFEERPWSRFSVQTESRKALDELLRLASSKRAKTIVTFPLHKCSNGLSGQIVRRVSRKYFKIKQQIVKGRLSSLGGVGGKRKGAAGRAARKRSKELILILTPRCTRSGRQ